MTMWRRTDALSFDNLAVPLMYRRLPTIESAESRGILLLPSPDET